MDPQLQEIIEMLEKILATLEAAFSPPGSERLETRTPNPPVRITP